MNKMRANQNLLCFLLNVVILASCTDALDKAPDGDLSMAEIWDNPDMVEQMLNTCYNNIPRKGYNYHHIDQFVVAISDDGWTSDDGQGSSIPSTHVYLDNNSAGMHYILDHEDRALGMTNKYWDRYWAQIRLCTQFIENIDKAAVHHEGNRARFKAETHLLRAFFYMELVKWFGKLPVIDRTLGFDFDYSVLRRQPVYEVTQLIVSDCNIALATPELPWRVAVASDAMRMTKALAHALKTKALLFAASPLHNEGNNYWEEAYQTAKTAVAELKANGYELFTVCTQSNVFGTGGAAALHQLVCQNVDYSASPRDKETIFQHKTGGRNDIWNIGYINAPYKVGTCPTQELVDAFETIDGKSVLDLSQPYLDEYRLQPNYNPDNTLYNRNDPYKNRDPRFYITVLYHGARFFYNGEEETVNIAPGGTHEPSLLPNNRVRSRTGYYHKKLVTPGCSMNNPVEISHWKFYRLGELLLDFAEAAVEADHLADAQAAVNEVRARSGMPSLPTNLSQADMRLRIHNERRVELVWEEQRYFDLRRWQTPDGDLRATCRYFTSMMVSDNGDGTFKYERRSLVFANPRGGSSNRDLLLPIPLNECLNLEELTGVKWQNPGW